MAEFSEDMLVSDDPARRIAAADAMVLARAEPAAEVWSAISHLCRSEWEEMKTALKRIGRKSPFAHWRLFLRGCAAHFTGDPGEARRCFARLPPESLPARKAPAFEVLQGNWREAGDGAVAGACLLTGEPKLAKVLPVVQQRWMQGKHLVAYLRLRQSISEFPSLKFGVWGQLTRFFQLADMDLPEDARHRWLEDALSDKTISKLRLDAETYILTNMLTRTLYGFGDFETLPFAWEQFLKCRVKLRGENARFAARCHLGAALALDPGPVHSSYGFSAVRNELYDPMIESLEASAKADPTFEEPCLKLLALHRALRRVPEANRLLDDMTKRFPESKAVLLEAGRACIDRKAHVKGLKYFEDARALDPLDAEIPALIRRGLREKAAAHFKKGTPPQIEKGRRTIEQLLSSIPRNPPFGESRGMVMVFWSVLEETVPDRGNSLAKEKFKEAGRELPPHVAEFCRALQRGLVAPGVRNGSRFRSRPPRIKGAKDPAQGLQIYRLWALLTEEQQDAMDFDGDDWTCEYLNTAIRKLRRGDRELALQLADELGKDPINWEYLGEDLVRKCLALDRSDPHFRCLEWTLPGIPPPTPAKIEKTKEEARRRHDQGALEAIARFESRPANSPRPGGFDDIYGDHSENDDVFGEELLVNLLSLDYSGRVDALLAMGAPLAKAEFVASMIDALGGTIELPESFPDLSPARPKPKPKSKPKPSPPKIDPNQLEFPF